MVSIIFYIFSMLFLFNEWNIIQGSLGLLTLFMMFKFSEYWLFSVNMNFGLDSISYCFILLTIWIMMLSIMASSEVNFKKVYSNYFVLVLLSLFLVLVFTFSCVDLVLFYIMFEGSLIPMLILVLGWGYQPERLQAGLYMFFYTLVASLPLLITLLYLYESSSDLLFSSISGGSLLVGVWYLMGLLAFLVKMPMYFVHLWLPKAHVEAPVAGSMILAGILLKLGGYGLMRFMSFYESVHSNYIEVWVSVGLLGGLMVSMMCLRQVDVKSLIAYSSVAHMGLVIGGLGVYSKWGYEGAFLIMIGHGLCSSGLFCIANYMYQRVNSRSMFLNKGLMMFLPSFSVWWFLLLVDNMSAPPSLNLLGELGLILGFMSWSNMLGFILFFLCLFSGVYCMYLYSMSQHGVNFSLIYSCNSGNVKEFLVLALHFLPLNLLFLKGEVFMF